MVVVSKICSDWDAMALFFTVNTLTFQRIIHKFVVLFSEYSYKEMPKKQINIFTMFVVNEKNLLKNSSKRDIPQT